MLVHMTETSQSISLQSFQTRSEQLALHVESLLKCHRCPSMQLKPVSGGPVVSPIMLVGQAPGDKEPILGRPFAWTAGKTLFRWFQEGCGITESQFRAMIYMAAVCRCFPGKKMTGGDRVPSPEEILQCGAWLDAEIALLKPSLIIPVGKLAIQQFLSPAPLNQIVGRQLRGSRVGVSFDLIPLPHPSGASPWHRMEPGKTLLRAALGKIKEHPGFAQHCYPSTSD